MKKSSKIFTVLMILCCVCSASVFAKKSEFNWTKDQVFSFDAGYKGQGLKSFGFGLDVMYERSITDFTSWKGAITHLSMWRPWDSNALTTLGASGGAYFYPFGKKLNFLYMGGEIQADFYMFKDYGTPKDLAYGVLFSAAPAVGFKFNFWDVTFFEIFVNYKFQLTPGENVCEEMKDYYKFGPGYGVKCKLNLGNLFNKFKKSDKKSSDK